MTEEVERLITEHIEHFRECYDCVKDGETQEDRESSFLYDGLASGLEIALNLIQKHR